MPSAAHTQKDGNCEATQRYRFRLTNPLLRKANNYSIYTLPDLPVAFTQTGTNAFGRDTIRSFPEGSGKKKKKSLGDEDGVSGLYDLYECMHVQLYERVSEFRSVFSDNTV